jgi:hypothetical protein
MNHRLGIQVQKSTERLDGAIPPNTPPSTSPLIGFLRGFPLPMIPDQHFAQERGIFDVMASIYENPMSDQVDA